MMHLRVVRKCWKQTVSSNNQARTYIHMTQPEKGEEGRRIGGRGGGSRLTVDMIAILLWLLCSILFYSRLFPSTAGLRPPQSPRAFSVFNTFVNAFPCCPTMSSLQQRFVFQLILCSLFTHFCASNGISFVCHSVDVPSPFPFISVINPVS